MNNHKYPKTIEELNEIISLNKNIYTGKELESYNKWIEWFNSFENIKLPDLNEDEYFVIYFDIYENFSLQVWNKNENYNILEYNILSNYIDEFNNNQTIVKKNTN